jgi:hypothetical protein
MFSNFKLLLKDKTMKQIYESELRLFRVWDSPRYKIGQEKIRRAVVGRAEYGTDFDKLKAWESGAKWGLQEALLILEEERLTAHNFNDERV